MTAGLLAGIVLCATVMGGLTALLIERIGR